MKEDYIVQIHPNQYRLYDCLKKLPSDNRLALNVGERTPLQKNKVVYLWDMHNDGKGQLVDRGTVLEERRKMNLPEWQHEFCVAPHLPVPNDDLTVIHVDVFLKSPISRGVLRENQVLREATFFRNERNIQGLVFLIKEDAVVNALDELIDKKIPEHKTSWTTFLRRWINALWIPKRK